MKIRKKAFLSLLAILCSGLLFLTACSCSGGSPKKTAETKIETTTETETETRIETESGKETTIEEATFPEISLEEIEPVIESADTSSEPDSEGPDETSVDEHYELPKISLDD